MKKIIVTGGGAAGMMAAVSVLQMGAGSYFLKKMKNLERSCLLPEREDAT